MARKTLGLSEQEIRDRQREAGHERLGPRVLPEDEEETSDAGYVARPMGTKHTRRNQGIVRQVAAAPKLERQKVVARLARKYDLSPKTIEHIARYFKTPS